MGEKLDEPNLMPLAPGQKKGKETRGTMGVFEQRKSPRAKKR